MTFKEFPYLEKIMVQVGYSMNYITNKLTGNLRILKTYVCRCVCSRGGQRTAMGVVP